MKNLTRIGAILVVFIVMFLMASPVLAADPPDSISIDVKYVNRNLIEDGDMLFYAIYDIAYAVLPDEDIDEIYIFRLVDIDGTTELGSNEAFPFQNQGYGKGLISFYFSAAQAAAIPLVWQTSYYIRVQGKPGFFATPPDELFIIDFGDYSTSTTQADNRLETRNNIISIARILESEFTTVTSLLINIEIGTVLNIDGEDYFRNSIFGLQAMVPSLFETQIVDPDYTERTWNTTQQEEYEGRLTGTTMGNSIQGLSDVFSLDFNMVASLPILIGSILAIIAAVKMNGKPEAGFLVTVALIIFGAFMGWTPFALVGVFSVVCFLYIAMLLVGRIPV